MKYDSLTLGRLKEMLAYDAETGVFTWRQRPTHNSRVRVGDVAGIVKKSGYRYIGIDNHTYVAGQLAWFYVTGKWAKGQVGIMNGNPTDLRFENLREMPSAGGSHDFETREGKAKYRRAFKDENPLVHRAYGWKRYYGIDAAEYQRMFLAQGGVCAICKNPERAKTPRTNELKWLSVDHCHKTGAVRSLLCSHCNHTIGHSGDDPELLEAAARYLRQYSQAATTETAGDDPSVSSIERMN